jgi:hypothetical protein
MYRGPCRRPLFTVPGGIRHRVSGIEHPLPSIGIQQGESFIMEYGLRRYEAVQRLLWFLYFLSCLAVVYFVQPGKPYPAYENIQLKEIRTFRFWYGLQGILAVPSIPDAPRLDLELESSDAAPKPKPPASPAKAPAGKTAAQNPAAPDRSPQLLGRLVVFLVQVGVIFLAGKLLWLLLQFVGKLIVRQILVGSAPPVPQLIKPDLTMAVNPENMFPRQLITRKVNRFPAGFLLHSIQRLKLLLAGSRPTLSSEDLAEKERRIVETDWQVLSSSWTPFNWLLWIVPALALVQTSWLIVVHFEHAATVQKEFMDVFHSVPSALFPLGQALGLVIFFRIACGLLRRMEDLYLSGLDALLYDRLLSRLPFQSGDTPVLLDVLQRQFQQISAALRRLERNAPGGQGEDRGR